VPDIDHHQKRGRRTRKLRRVVADLAEGLAERLVVAVRGVGGLGLQGKVTGAPAVDEVSGFGAVAVDDVDGEFELILAGSWWIRAGHVERLAKGEEPGLEGGAFGDGEVGPGGGECLEVGGGGVELGGHGERWTGNGELGMGPVGARRARPVLTSGLRGPVRGSVSDDKVLRCPGEAACPPIVVGLGGLRDG